MEPFNEIVIDEATADVLARIANSDTDDVATLAKLADIDPATFEAFLVDSDIIKDPRAKQMLEEMQRPHEVRVSAPPPTPEKAKRMAHTVELLLLSLREIEPGLNRDDVRARRGYRLSMEYVGQAKSCLEQRSEDGTPLHSEAEFRLHCVRAVQVLESLVRSLKNAVWRDIADAKLRAGEDKNTRSTLTMLTKLEVLKVRLRSIKESLGLTGRSRKSRSARKAKRRHSP